jgi:acetyltransferase-like isoleucine patch superfamily enzyme
VFINKIVPKKINKFFLVFFRNFPTAVGVLIRYVLLKNICQSCGKNVIVFQGVIFDAPEMMSIGDNVSINPYCYLAGEISIGNDVAIAHTTALHSFNHTWENMNLPISCNSLYSKRIIIENDVWIACNCVLLSGVKIGKRSVIAAGAIVTKSFSNNSLVGGNPARLIKKI